MYETSSRGSGSFLDTGFIALCHTCGVSGRGTRWKCSGKISRVMCMERFVESHQDMQSAADRAAELAQQDFECTYEVRRKGSINATCIQLPLDGVVEICTSG